MKYLLLCLLLLLTTHIHAFNVILGNNAASARTYYNLSISLYADSTNTLIIPANTSSSLVFPSQYNNRLTNGVYNCSVDNWGVDPPQANPVPICTLSGNTMTINNLFMTQYLLDYSLDFLVKIENTINPLTAGSTGTFYFNVGTTNFQTIGPLIKEATMSCVVTTSPANTGQSNGKMLVQFTTPEFLTTSILKITMDLYWPKAKNNTQPIITDVTNVTCLAVANASSSISCSWNSSVSLKNIVGVISNIVSNNLAETSVIFSFGSIITPPTTMPQGSIKIYASTNNSAMSSCIVPVTGIIPASLSNVQFVPISTIINSVSSATLRFTINTNLVSSDVITIIFPLQISLSNLTSINQGSINGNAMSFTRSNQSVILNGSVLQAGQSVVFVFSTILNPSSENPTSSFNISTFRDGYYMDMLTYSFSYIATRTYITSASITATNLQIGASTTYNIGFVLGQLLGSNSGVVVSLPSMFQGLLSNCFPSCTVTSTKAIFTNVSTGVGSLISLTLNGANPVQIGNTSSLTLYTLYNVSQSTSYVEYTNTGLTLNLIGRVIPSSNIIINSSSPVISMSPVSFSFVITNVNPLPANVYLQIVLPVQVGVAATGQVSCMVGASAISCNYNSASRIITFSSITSASLSAGQLNASTVVISNLVNPTSTIATSSFGLSIINSGGLTLEYQTTGLTFAATQAASFYSLNLIPNNTQNSAATSLSVSFSITAASYVNGSLLAINFPSSISIQSTSCAAISSNLISVSCSPSGNKMQALLLYNSLDTNRQTQILILPYSNYPSLQPYTLTVDLYQDIFQGSKLYSSSSPASFQNLQSGTIILSSHSFTSTILAGSTNLNIQINATSASLFGYVTISLPFEFGVSGVGCSLPYGFTCTLQGQSVVVNSSNIISLPLIFTVNNLTAPSFSPSSNIYIQTKNSNGYLMDSNTQIFFATACTLPCRTCTTAPTSCTSCYTNTTLVAGQIYQNGSNCVSVCGTGLYLDSVTNSCTICPSPCATCQSTSICYTCTNSFLYNGSCLLTCPFGYYGFNGLCLVCNAALYCQSCPNNYQCSSCISGYYYYNNLCYSSCPALVTYANLVYRTCDPCPTNCTACQGNSSNLSCTACVAGYVLDNNRCYLTCQTAGLIAVNSVCQGCTSPCSTCAITVTNCTACNTSTSSPYLYQYKCLSQCPNGYYNQNTTYSCNLCTPPCQMCDNISVHSCKSCTTGYYLYQSDCLSSCPSGFYSSTGLCLACVSPCVNCSDATTCLSCISSTYLYRGQCLSQCPTGMTVINGNQCLVCASTCKSCSASTFCTSCYTSTYLYNGTCSASCPNGTFANTTTLVCDFCTSPCDNCQSTTYCLTCLDTSKFLTNGNCVVCQSPCASCSGSISNCTSCLTNISTPYIFNFSCLVKCPATYYSDNATYKCSLCVSPCLTCDGPTNSSCLSCVGGYYLLLNLCYSVCPTTYYPNVNQCTACVTPCSTCSSYSVCLSCTNNTYLYGSACVSNCGTGMNIINNSICAFCDVSCKTCLSSNASACTSCYSGAFLNQNTLTCSSACPVGFFTDSSTGNGLCVACLAPCGNCSSAAFCLSCLDNNTFLVNGSCTGCSSPCLTCSGLRTNCTSCYSNSTNPYLYGSTCNSGCLFGYYPDASFTCRICTSPCSSCTNASTSACLTCLSGYLQLNNTCYLVCPSGYYANATICTICVSNCQTCSSSSTCLSCVTNFYLYGSNCLSSCPNGAALINGTTCEYCNSTCKTCLTSNTTACTSCNPTTYLNSNLCISTCPNGTYADNTTNVCEPCLSPCGLCQSLSFCLSCLDSNKFLVGGSCVGCTSPCITCSLNPNNCTSCALSTGFPYLLNYSCLSSCPGGYYNQSSANRCYVCVSPCQTCTSASINTCLSCISNYLFFQGSCLLACPNSYYSNNITCLACPSPCQNCNDNNTCTSCQGALLLQGATCVITCSVGLTAINSLYCSYCNGSCLSCLSSNTSACTSCYSGAYLLGNACYAICPSLYFGDSVSSKCLPCQSPCSTCTSASQCLTCQDLSLFVVNSSCVGCLSPCLACSLSRTNCTACDSSSGFPYLINNACYANCPANTYSSSSNCLPCVSPCSSCLNASTSSCLSCITGYLLFNTNCLLGCPSGYYSDSVTCVACTSPCSTCSSPLVCLSCVPNYYLLGSTCISSCPGGMIVSNTSNGGVCAYCNSSCSTCLTTNTSYCTGCPNFTYLYLGQCLTNCSAGFYANTVSFTCNACSVPCKTCISPSQCLACILNTDFLINFTCMGCQSSCLTCLGSISTCTSCNTSGSYPYFFQNSCINTCPSTYYNDASFNCTLCVSPCDTCTGAGNQSCITCLSGYLQLNSSCYIACPGGYYNLSNQCLPCTSPCFTCFGAGTSACLSCTSGLYLLGSACVANCSGMAVNGNTCVYCASSCLTCLSTNSSYCTSCNGLFLYSGSCVSSCVSGYYADTNLSACVPCLSPCGNCTSSTSCLSCVSSNTFLIGTSCMSCQFPCLSCSTGISVCASCNTSSTMPYFYQNNCLGTCPSTYYNDASFNCTKCTSPCNTCSGAGNQSCLTCLSGYLQLNSSCYVSCPGGYYNLSNQCLPCTSPCFTCFGPGTSACLSCSSGLYLLGSTCVANCNGLGVNGNNCVYCSASCLTCLSTNSSYCTSCTGLFLYSGSCVSSCVAGYYSDANSSSCMPCLSPCANCSSATLCLSCVDNTKFLINSVCVGCSSPCLTCSLSVNNCTSCDSLSSSPFLLNYACLSSCPLGYYQQTPTKCTLCTSPCNTCNSSGIQSCLSCVSNTYILGSTCYSVCPTGYFVSINSCLPCSSPCSTCQITNTTCTSCISGYYLRGSSCVTNCSTGQIIVSNAFCQVCTSNCLTCVSSNFSYCTSCQNGTYLSVGACLATCPNTTYPDSTNNICVGCVSPCQSCTSQTQCTSCVLSTLFLVNFSCQSCLTPCLTCLGSQTNCTSCNTSSARPYYFNNGCLVSCPSGYYDGGSFNCLACILPCSTCTAGNNRSCLTCTSGYSQLGNDCYSTCPSGYYSNGSNCISCNSSLCLTCTSSPSTCLSCINGLYLLGSSCQASCPLGMLIINNSICSSCTSNCMTCLTLNTSYCTSCLSNNYLFNGICNTSCPNYYYSDPSGNCVHCTSPCLLCQSVSSCLTCIDPTMFLQNNTCVSACSYPLVGINSTCYRCASQCLTCTQTVSTCLLCANSFYYYTANFTCSLYCPYFILPKNISSTGNNECTQTCPSGTYTDNSTKYCVSCPISCKLCNNSTYCSECNTGYSFYSSFCYSPCPAMAPYAVNAICIMCNIANCQTCLNTTYCQECSGKNLLIAGTNNATSSCIASCPSGQQYNQANLKCQDIPRIPVTSNIVQSSVPPHTFLISTAALTFISFIIKFKYPAANLPLTLFLCLQMTNLAAIVNLLTIELPSSGITQGNFAGASISTFIILSSAGIQVIASLGSIITVLKIRDNQMVKIWISNPITFVVLMVISAIDSNLLFITTSQILDISCFQAKLSSDSMTKVFIFGIITSLVCKGLNSVYSAMQLLFYNKNAYRLLATVAYPISNSLTIEFIVIAALSIFLAIYMICSLRKEQKQEDSKQESHQSLIDQSKFFDKRNQSNAQIMMSVDNSDMVVDINSLKDQKQISSIDNSNFLFQNDDDSKNELPPPQKRRLKNKKITPDQMLKQMNDKIDEENQTEMLGLDNTDNVFFAKEDDGEEYEKVLQDNNTRKQNQDPEIRNETPMLDITDNDVIDNNETAQKIKYVGENSVQLVSSPSKLADISEITYRQGEDKSRSNIFDNEQLGEPDQKTKTEIIKVVQQNVDPQQEKYSPSELSKYKPNENIVKEFAQNSYLDDAMKFHEHEFEIKQKEIQPITFEEVNDNYDELNTIEEISFQKKQKFVEPDFPVQPKSYSKEDIRRIQDQDIAQILEQEPHYNIGSIQQEDQYKERQTPSIRTPITNSFFDAQLEQEQNQFKPSEGLKGKKNRRAPKKKPDIPLPKNEIQKEIISIYHQNKEKKQSKKKRYPDIPLPKQSKTSHYIQYQMEDQYFVEESNIPKPIFSGEIRKQPGSRYNKSIQSFKSGSGQGSIYDEDMPAKPSLKLRKSSFKKVGEMIIENQHSARK